MDTRVFVCTHKLFHQPEESMYHPLQVGHALHEDLGYETERRMGQREYDNYPKRVFGFLGERLSLPFFLSVGARIRMSTIHNPSELSDWVNEASA